MSLRGISNININCIPVTPAFNEEQRSIIYLNMTDCDTKFVIPVIKVARVNTEIHSAINLTKF